MKKYKTVREAAQELKIGTLYVYVLLRDNKLTGRKKLDGRWLISASSIAARKQQLGDKNGNTTRNHSPRNRTAVSV